MDIKEGHPGGLFHWFFDTNQGADNIAQMVFFLYGSSTRSTALAQECLRQQVQFDDALGPEIIFTFFDPDISNRKMIEDGKTFIRSLERHPAATYLFSGMGQAHPVPDGLIEIGRRRFRSERPGSMYFDGIAAEASKAHQRAIPFFQEAFGLKALTDYFFVAHRKQRTISIFELDGGALLKSDDFLQVARALRPVARHSKGEADLGAIDLAISALTDRGVIRGSFMSAWNNVRGVLRSLPR